MIKSKGILTISIISLFAVESAYAAIASSGYVDQQVGTKISEVTATETGTGNVVSSISADGNTVTATKGITALTNTATGENSVSTGGATSTASMDSVSVGYKASSSGHKNVALGSGATTKDSNTVAVGYMASASAGGSIAIGTNATSSAPSAIQLGEGTNTEVNTFSVGNYKLLGSDGKIPAERLPFEGEALTNTATGSGSVSTGGADPVTTSNAIAIGDLASAQNGGISLGSASGALFNGVSVGTQSSASNQAVVIGAESSASGLSSIAIGSFASADADYAIQLGKGENSEANTFSVGLSDTANYKLLGSDGKIPAERLPFEGDVLTNTATGNSATAINADDAAGVSSVALGSGASVGQNGAGGTAIGPEATVEAAAGTALGATSKVTAEYAIQLGKGTNSEANTLSVGLSETTNYKLLGSDGKIPAERLPFEGDVLTNTATGSGSFSTGDADVASAEGAVAIGSGSVAWTQGVAIGTNAVTNSGGEMAIGYNTETDNYDAIAIGDMAKSMGGNSIAIGSRTKANGLSGTAVGHSAEAGASAAAFGGGASALATGAVALGGTAKSQADYAIQLGAGTNSEANTLSVGLDGTNNYKLLGSDGKIPAGRLPVATSSTLGGVKSGGDISISSTGAVSVVSALKAVQDANGDNIAATYATKASVNDLNNNKVQKDWTTSNVNKVLVIGSDENYPDVLGKVTVARITENFLDDAIQNKLDTAVTNVTSSGTGSVIAGFSKSGNTMTVTRTNVQIPVGSATATSYASIWVE